jgi:hypothetical protein
MRASGPEELRAPVERAPTAVTGRAGSSGPRKAPVRQVEPPANGRGLLGLQASAGNAAVGTLVAAGARAGPLEIAPQVEPLQVAQRLAGAPASIPPPPTPPRPPVPTEHPGFNATQTKLSAARRGLTAHAPARAKADEAARAAKPPADDKEAQAKAAKAGDMGAAPTPGFDKAAFIAAVTAAIAKQTPKNLDEADTFASSGKSDAVGAEVRGKVAAGKDASAKPMADASAKAPDVAKAKDKPVTEIPPAPPVGAPPAVGAGAAMPAKAPSDQTDLGNGPATTDQKMAESGVTEEQLAKSNEPEFTGALAAKKEGEAHSATAPAAFRQGEGQQLAAAQQSAQGAGTQAVAAMVGGRATGLQQVAGGQQQARSADEQKRAEVAARIKSIFDTSKTEVDAILNGLDALVDAEFTAGEQRAKSAFTSDLTSRMERYKDERYSGPSGWAQWVADQFKPLPPEVQAICHTSKKLYEAEMSKVISSVADIIGRELTRAKDRVARGRQEIATYVDGLDPALRSVGQQAAKDIGSQFDALTESIDEKSQSLAEDLAEKYVAARQVVDDEITTMQEENKGLWDKAKDAIGGAIETILKLKSMLMGVLARAAGAVEKIIKDPIGFLGNFVNAVKTGVMNFGANILEHLKKGLQSWLFGALAEAGIEIPATFDLKGIVGLILSLLGLTWASIRARLAKVLPDWVITAMEKAVEVVQILTTEGVGGLWKWIVTKISDLKEQVMSQIREFVITKVITAGITWLISLLNPAAAFIKACKMIYDAVMWFVDNAERLGDFVSSVLDSVESIAAGGVGKVAALIEATLGKAVPMVISGLASLLGLGGIADKIKKILETIQKPVGKVVDGIISGVVKYGKKLLGKLKRKKKPKGVTGPQDSAAGAKAKQDAEVALRGRLGSTADDPARVRAAVTGVYAQYRGQGITGIHARPQGPGSLGFEVTVSRMATVAVPAVTTLLEKDFKVRVGASGRATGVPHVALAARWNGQALPRQESVDESHHAEDELVGYVRSNRDTLAKPPPGERNRLEVTLTKSPCPRCGVTLNRFAAAEQSSMVLSMTGLYHGKKQTREEKQASIEALLKLRMAGVELRVPTVEEVAADNGIVIDPRSMQALRARLDRLRTVVDAVNAKVAGMAKVGAGS